MRKSILKRIKITGTGKILTRRQGGNHFNAKESRGAQLRRKTSTHFSPAVEKKIRQMING